MEKIYRAQTNHDYWDQRWEKARADQRQFARLDMYPILYADMVASGATKILEAGCGLGRLYFHYEKQGKIIEGVDSSEVAIRGILTEQPNAKVRVASILDLPFPDGSFDAVLAFGLYHNIESEPDVAKAFSETARVIRPGGRIVFSVRHHSWENRLTEVIERFRHTNQSFDKFHRWHFALEDVQEFLADAGLKLEKHFFVRNVSFMFKFDIFRDRSMKSSQFVEAKARSEGFRLNPPAQFLSDALFRIAPAKFSNLMVVIARKG